MKWLKKALIAVLLLLIIAAGSLAWWQRENLQALKEGGQSSPEEIEDKLAQNQQAIKDAVDAASEVTIRDVTDEEKQALKDGTLTPEDLANRLVEDAKPKPADPQLPSSPVVQEKTKEDLSKEGLLKLPQEEKPVEDKAYEKEVSAIIAQIYVLREQYIIQLENMYNEAKTEYKALPEKDRAKSNLVKIASGYISRATDLEKECDKKVLAIANELELVLQENNGDVSLAQTVYDSYVREKSLKKAWYMSEMKKRGLV